MSTRFRATLAVACAALVAGCASSSKPSPDPGGRLLADLRSVLAALPPASLRVDLNHTLAEPERDHCETGGASGYDPATVEWSFTTSWGPAQLTTSATQTLATLGWRPVTQTAGRATWTKEIEGVEVSAQLDAGQESTSGPTEWTLTATAPSKVSPLDCGVSGS